MAAAQDDEVVVSVTVIDFRLATRARGHGTDDVCDLPDEYWLTALDHKHTFGAVWPVAHHGSPHIPPAASWT